MLRLEDEEKQKLTEKFKFNSEKQFRLLPLVNCFEITLAGKTQIPLASVRSAMKSWATEWAGEQDLASFSQAVHQSVSEFNRRNVSQKQLAVDQESQFRFNPETLRNILLANRVDLKKTFQYQHGRRSGNLAFVIVWEMLMAMVQRFEQIALGPDTIWVFPEQDEKVDISSILDWLFRR